MNKPLDLMFWAVRDTLTKSSKSNGGRSGWPPGMLQDDSAELSRWLSSRPDAMYRLRQLYSESK